MALGSVLDDPGVFPHLGEWYALLGVVLKQLRNGVRRSHCARKDESTDPRDDIARLRRDLGRDLEVDACDTFVRGCERTSANVIVRTADSTYHYNR